jgi:hypothetical protein
MTHFTAMGWLMILYDAKPRGTSKMVGNHWCKLNETKGFVSIHDALLSSGHWIENDVVSNA